MPRELSLHPLNALDATPVQLVRIAAALAVGRVCLFTHVPAAAAGFYPLVTEADVAELGAVLAGEGVALCNLEVFPLDSDGAPDHLRSALATGAALGATKATAHIHEIADERQAIDRFGAFADIAAEYGIVAGLEFHNFSAVRDVGVAERIVRGAGHGSLVLDVLHLVRGGGGPADAARVADLVGYVQLSDGPAEVAREGRWREAVTERQLPGEGALPLEAIVAPLPTNAIFEVEVPQAAARKSGVPALERCRRSIEAARALLARVDAEVTA